MLQLQALKPMGRLPISANGLCRLWIWLLLPLVALPANPSHLIRRPCQLLSRYDREAQRSSDWKSRLATTSSWHLVRKWTTSIARREAAKAFLCMRCSLLPLRFKRGSSHGLSSKGQCITSPHVEKGFYISPYCRFFHVVQSARKMAKRKPDVVSDEEEDQEMSELVDVDFDFFDLQEDDFHAISNLIKQLLSHDAKDFDVSGLSDFVIQQKLGSTVKCDGESSAAYAFCSVINIAQTAVRLPFACLALSLKTLLECCCHSIIAISLGEDSTKGIQNFRTLAAMPFRLRQGLCFTTRHCAERTVDQYASSNYSAFPSSAARRDGESSQAGSPALGMTGMISLKCRTGLSHFNTSSFCLASSCQKQKRQKRRR